MIRKAKLSFRLRSDKNKKMTFDESYKLLFHFYNKKYDNTDVARVTSLYCLGGCSGEYLDG